MSSYRSGGSGSRYSENNGRSHSSHSRSSHHSEKPTFAHSRHSDRYTDDSRRNRSLTHHENNKDKYSSNRYSSRQRDSQREKHNDENFDYRCTRNLTNDQPNCFINIKTEPIESSSRQLSPLKRRNNDESENSPQKRVRENLQAKNMTKRFNLSSFTSPKKGRSSSLCNIKKENKFFSTPKSERKMASYKTKIKEMLEQNSITMQRNLSNNWADILEELDEQAKEVENYIDKVSSKYDIDKEKLRKNLETDAEVLRKRQKRINFGKVTTEYQRYLMEMPKKKRESFHPRTPNKFRKCSRRKFDGLVKKWRKMLHAYDEDPDQLHDMKYIMYFQNTKIN